MSENANISPDMIENNGFIMFKSPNFAFLRKQG